MKKPILYLVSGAFAVSAAAGAGIYSAAHKTITLDIDGNTTQVTTFKGSVDGLLEENGIVLADGDLVVPSIKSSLEEAGDVVVRYQREVTLDRDGETQKLKTTALDADELLTSLAARGNDGSLVVSRSMGNERVAIDLRLNSDGPVAVIVDGTNEVVDSGTGQIQDILDAQDIELGSQDRVSVHTLPKGATSLAQATEQAEEASSTVPATDASSVADSDSIVTLVIERVATKTETKTVTTEHKTKTIKDANRFEDLGKKLKTKGVDGKVTTTFEVFTVDGVEESRTQVSQKVDQKAVTQVYVVGTKERPKVTVSKKSSSSSSSSSSGSSSSSDSGTSSVGSDVWARLAQCESGGNPSIVSRNGLYHGLYQFSVGTWRSVGGSGLPSQASAAEQTKRAKILQARSGWGQWPHCSSKLGLR